MLYAAIEKVTIFSDFITAFSPMKVIANFYVIFQ